MSLLISRKDSSATPLTHAVIWTINNRIDWQKELDFYKRGARVTMNGAAYVRVSTDDQIEFSIAAQLKAIKCYAKQSNILLTEEHIYIDEGISGKHADKRPAFMRMVGAAKVKPRPFDIILVHKFDRFARSREDSVVYKSLLRKEYGVKVVSITENVEDDKFSVILEAMLEAMAEYYSLNLADEVIKGMTEKAERGELQCSASLGYDVVDNKLVINGNESAIIKMIFLKFTNREMTIRQIAMMLNEIGARTKRGNLFENRTVQYILRNPVYIGKLRWTPKKTPNSYRSDNNPNAIIRDAGHEPIIDMDTWNEAQQRLAEIKKLFGHRQRQTAKVRTWLKGLVFCGNCGRALIQSQVDYLQCNGYNKGKCSTSCCIRIDKVEELVLAELETDFPDRIEIDIVSRQSEKTLIEEYEIIRAALQKFDTLEQRMKKAYQTGIDTLEEYGDNKKLMNAEKKRLTECLDKLKANFAEEPDKPINKTINNIYTLLTSAKIEMNEKYAAAHCIINKIIFSRQENLLEIEYR